MFESQVLLSGFTVVLLYVILVLPFKPGGCARKDKPPTSNVNT